MTDLTDLSIKLREVTTKITEINAQLNTAKKYRAELEQILLDKMDAMGNGLYSFSTSAGTLGINETDVGTVEDWDKFYEYIYDNKAWHMLERRIAQVPYREMLEAEMEVPGVKKFTKRTISLTKGKDKK